MAAATTRGRWTTRPLARTLLLGAVFALGACSGGDKQVAGPDLPTEPPLNPAFKKASFIFDVNLRTRQVRVTQDQGATSITGPGFSLSGSGPGPSGPNFSILAGDVVQLSTSNFTASAVGQFTPNKVRVNFDVNITNRLPGIELITPTFPEPPAGVQGILLFPYQIVVTTTTGGTSVGGDGTDVIVELPNRGNVESSIDWNGTGAAGSGAPHNFFNDANCAPGSSDCYRWEGFAVPLAAGGTSEARSVGFDIDPTVSNFRARLIVAADLRATGATPVGTIQGSVTSPQRGALSGVLVSATPGTRTGTSAASGAYTITDVTTGPKTVALSNLPAGCTAPATQSVTVASGGTHTVNFSVTCSVPAGTVSGTVTSSLGGGLQNVQVVVTPTGGSAQPAVVTSATGAYSRSAVPVLGGSGSVALSNLPANCTAPAPGSYSGLTDGGSVVVDFTVSCTAPPAMYQYTHSWGPITAGQTTLTVRFNPSTYNDPAINGASADDFAGIQGQIDYDGARLQYVSSANGAGSPFQNVTANGGTNGRIIWLNSTTSPSLILTEQVVAVFTFNVRLGATGALTPVTSLTEIPTQAGQLLNLARVQINEATLNIP